MGNLRSKIEEKYMSVCVCWLAVWLVETLVNILCKWEKYYLKTTFIYLLFWKIYKRYKDESNILNP